jgi:hypothetical protein
MESEQQENNARIHWREIPMDDMLRLTMASALVTEIE